MRRLSIQVHTVLAALALSSMPDVALAQTVQGLYAGNDPSLPTIDVYYSVLWYDFKTEDVSADGGSTPFTDVPMGISIDAAVAEGSSTSSSEAFFTASYTFESDTNYVKIVNGVRDPAQFAPNPDGRSTAVGVHGIDGVRRYAEHPDSVDLFVYHGSIDAPAIDVVEGGGTLVAEGVRYGDNGPYFTVAANSPISLVVSRASDGLAYGTYTGTAGSELAGQSAIIMVRGFVDPSANMNGRELVATVVPADGAAFDLAVETSTALDDPDLSATRAEVFLGSAWPNPASERISVHVTVPTPRELEVRIFDILGRAVLTRQAPISSGSSTLEFSIEALPVGQYIVVAGSGASTASLSFAIVR